MKAVKSIAVAVALSASVGTALGELRDVGATYSQNAIKVELEKDGELIRFSYCKDRRVATSCALLGKGLYRVDDLKHFRTIQKWKMAGNGIGFVGGTVGGFLTAVVGGITAPAAGVGVLLVVAGTGMTAGGVAFFSQVAQNFKQISALSDPTLEDKAVTLDHYTDGLDRFLLSLRRNPDTPENRALIEEIIKRRDGVAYGHVAREANTIQAILLRLDVEVNEK